MADPSISFNLPLVLSAGNKFQSGHCGQCPVVPETVNVGDCALIVSRHVDKDIGVDEIGHPGDVPLSPGVIAKMVHVAHAVGYIVAVCPQSGEFQVADGWWRDVFFLGHVNVNHRALLNLHYLEGFEDSVLVFCRDRHDRDQLLLSW
jgi:hypothetical protein